MEAHPVPPQIAFHTELKRLAAAQSSDGFSRSFSRGAFTERGVLGLAAIDILWRVRS